MILSDDPAWWHRAQERRRYCPGDAPWITVAQVGWPAPSTPTLQGLPYFEQSQKACSDYLRATGLVASPGWVYGIGPRAVWPDRPGRWFVAHAATPAVLDAARAHLAGAPAPTSPGVGHTWIAGHATQLVKREVGEPGPTICDALAAAVAFAGVDPAQTYGAYCQAWPVQALSEYGATMTIDESGLVISTPPHLSGWQPAFDAGCPYLVDPVQGTAGAAGPVVVVRFGYEHLAARAAAGDPRVPASPVEVAVCFAETVGIQPSDCWSFSEGIAGFTRGSRPKDAYGAVIYRPRAGDAEGRARFRAYMADLGFAAEEMAAHHPERVVTMSRGRIKGFRGTR